MTAKEYLDKYRWAEQEYFRIQKKLNDIYADNVSFGSSGFSERVQSSPSGDNSMINLVENISKKKSRLQDECYTLYCVMNDIESSIEEVQDNRKRLLLKYKYIDGKTLEEIAAELNYSYRHIKRLHSEALFDIVVPEKYINFENMSPNVP